ncbi:MAG: hypothetical protein AAGA68_26680 [Pseudomonadota bacterium]
MLRLTLIAALLMLSGCAAYITDMQERRTDTLAAATDKRVCREYKSHMLFRNWGLDVAAKEIQNRAEMDERPSDLEAKEWCGGNW